MNVVLYYSRTNESFKIAKYISEKVHYNLANIENLDLYEFANAFIVFPIYSQNIPLIVKKQIKRLSCQKIVIIATYGKMHFGRAIYEASKIINAKVVGGAYIPCKHSYKPDDQPFNEYNRLDEIISLIDNENEVIIPKTKKNPFSNMLRGLRARLGVKIIKTNKCLNCNKCHSTCPNIRNGKPNSSCIRCLKCVYECPNQALEIKLRPIHKKYLKKIKENELIIYKK